MLGEGRGGEGRGGEGRGGEVGKVEGGKGKFYVSHVRIHRHQQDLYMYNL